MKRLLLLTAILLSGCASYETIIDGDIVTIQADGGIPVLEKIWSLRAKACPTGWELLSQGKKDSLSFFKYRCL